VLVWGERDPILGRALARHREALPQASVEVTQAGHFLQEEVPDGLARRAEGARGDASGLPGDRAVGARGPRRLPIGTFRF
jgi:hypothetical protein